MSDQLDKIKIGAFELQTKSFWIGLVCILTLFLLSVIWVNTYYWYKVCNNLIELNSKYVSAYENKK